MEVMKVISLNTRGLRNGLKRRKIFRFIKRSKPSVYFLQETHATKEMEQIWESEFGHKLIYANGESASRGVIIGLDNKIAKSVEEVIRI